ncbi:putative ethanolamine transporter [Escherichia coli]|uniref:Putative ethanolamine transporter n=1 Tax=Escherichia coli TaxID=562 RepID=A0A377BU82_ECOLX|nr:putative ethanolamine transporter [Escherichia coli]
MVLLLTRWFEKPLMSVGKVLNMNNIAAAGMVATLANNIPMFGMMKQMDTAAKSSTAPSPFPLLSPWATT